MGSYNYGSIGEFTAWLSTEFGLNIAMKWFNLNEEEIESIFGRYKKGKRKGYLKGMVIWKRCTHGGWFHLINGGGFVCPSTKVIFHKQLVLPVWDNKPEIKKRVGVFSNSVNDDLGEAWIEYKIKIEDFKKNNKGELQ